MVQLDIAMAAGNHESMRFSRRDVLKAAGLAVGSVLAPATGGIGDLWSQESALHEDKAEYSIRIASTPVEVSAKLILSTTTYNGQFPGPLLRFKEGRPATIDIFNDTSTPEQLHWHGQTVSVNVDGSAEEGTPFIPAHGRRRIVLSPGPSGVRFYHTHNRAGADLSAGTYSGQAGPVYIEPKDDPGRYDREVFLTLKEFQPTLSRGGDMTMDFLSPSAPVRALREQGESAMKDVVGERRRQGVRSWIWCLHDQWANAGAWRTNSSEVRRANTLPCSECERHRDSQPGIARPLFSNNCARRQCST